MDKKIKVFAPATVANLGPGYDILGLALDGIGDSIEVSLSDNAGIEIVMPGHPTIPTDPNKNVAGVAIKAMLDELGAKEGFHVKINKNIMPGSGLGTSASSSMGAVFAVNELLNKPFEKMELIRFGMAGEASISGKPHADNVAPCLLGGITLVRSYDPLDIINLEYPKNLYATIVHPQIEVKTSVSKKILKKEVPLESAVKQWGNVAGLVAGFAKSDYDLISRSLEDHVVEPTRSMLIPGFYELKKAALKVGALGCSISGSGPSVFALSTSIEKAGEVELAFAKIMNVSKIGFNTYVSVINSKGIEIINQ